MANAELFLRLSAVGILAFFSVLWWRGCRSQRAGWLGVLFCFGVASYLLCPPLARIWQFGVIEAPFFFGCFGSAVFFWLFSRALFEDSFRLRAWHGGLLLLAEGLGTARWLLQDVVTDLEAGSDLVDILLLMHQLLSLALIAWALALAYLGRAGDLVERPAALPVVACWDERRLRLRHCRLRNSFP